MYNGSTILLTGGTGSFGKAFVREVLAKYEPRRLIIFSRDELKQYEMARELSPTEHPALRYFIGDVRDKDRLMRAMDGVDYVVHAAAMKQVTTAEYNPFECIRTNIGGAENVIHAAIDCGVKRVLALSTDKAANPINLYGATKLAADKCFVAANHLAATAETRFSVVRYGNVMGSRGSVVEYFMKLVKSGATTLPVTHKQMTRFWITLQRGVEFVLQRLEAMQGGEIFVPKLASMSVVDLARAIGPDCEIEEIGIRPGEKLHEVLIPFDEARNTLEFSGHYTLQPAFSWWSKGELVEPNGEQGKTIEKRDWQYRSSSNDWWLTKADLLRLIEEEDRRRGECAA